MPKELSLAAALGLLRPGMAVYVPGLSAEHSGLIRALQADPSRADDVTFCGAWVPGVNRFDYAGVHCAARSMSFFLPPELHESFMRGRVRFHALPYTAVYALLAESIASDIAFLHLSWPDASGICSTGIAADFAPAVWRRARVRIGLLNECMPPTRSPGIPLRQLDYVVRVPSELIEYRAAALDDTTVRIAANVASLVRDDDVIQIGIGDLPRAVLAQLHDRRRLQFHTGMVTDGVAQLLDAGAIAAHADSIRTGVALGSRDFYRRIAAEPRASFHAVPITHGFDELKHLRRFVAINSAVTVDLFGQLNVEVINGRQISGVGGITDFMRGAAAAPDGRAIVALPSTAKGAVSRIVCTHPAGTPIASSRCEPLIAVTEHGIADLRGLALDARAEALISIAEPAFRAELSDQWRELRASL
jgi:acyl-CoA hydrolase